MGVSSRSSQSLLSFLIVLSLGLASCGGATPSASDLGATDPGATDPATHPDAVVTEPVNDATPPSAAPTATPTPATASENATFPVTIDAANGSITITERPDAIISLSPTATEILFAIGAGDQVVAVDEQSDYPPEAPTSELSGFQPNIEAIAGYEPDLVVASGDTTEEESLTDALGELGIPVIVQPGATTVDDTYDQIEQLGTATGHIGEAADVVSTVKSELEQIAASVPEFENPPAIYHELDPMLYSATSATFIGSIYEMLGATNIADEAEGAADYPQLSAEYILDSDPDIIFLADTECCDVTAESIAERPGWDEITAVQQGNVVELGDDIPSRWGPRVVEFARIVSDALAAADSVTS